MSEESKEIHITRASDLDEDIGVNTEGMVRKGAIVDKSDKLCASGTIVEASWTKEKRCKKEQS